jgi:hypothetical protein
LGTMPIESHYLDIQVVSWIGRPSLWSNVTTGDWGTPRFAIIVQILKVARFEKLKREAATKS